MKAKVKLDSAQLKGFLIQHVEKIVFGGFVVAFLLICWSAFKLKPYEKTPGELSALADKVSKEVEAKTPPEKFDGLPNVPDFSNLGAVGPAPVNPTLYRIAAISRPYEDRQERRKEPKFFSLQEPLAYAGYGGIAINEKGGVERIAADSLGSGMGMDPMSMYGGGMSGGYGNSGSMMQSGMMQSGMMQSGMMQSGMMQSGMMQSGSGMMPGSMEGMSGMMQGGMQEMMQGGGARGRRAAQQRKKVSAKKPEKKPVLPRPKPQITEKIMLPQPPSGSEVKGRYWVCLVGAIPYRKQFAEYQNAFRDAGGYDIKRDYPRYYGQPQIERAEVNGDKLGKWESLNLEEVIDDLTMWAAEYPEVVDKQFLDPDVTEPLPPLIYANHDKDKVNHPRTKLVEQKPKAALDEAKKKKPRGITGTRGPTNGPYGASGGMSGMGYGGDMYGGGMGMAGMGQGGLPVGPAVEHRLFRFFDFDVDPGKTYRYRVKLVLNNPNYDVQRRYLESYEYGKGETREADWSEPSPPVTVIAGNRLLAGSVTHNRNEPEGKLLAKLFDSDEATEIRKIFDIKRGSVLNQHEVEIGLPDAAGSTSKRPVTVDIDTNAVVLDMFGGEKLPGARTKSREEAPKVPGHILVLDNDGEIKTLLQAHDIGMYETEAEEAKNQSPPDKKPGAANTPTGGGANDAFNNFNFGGADEGTKKPKNRR